MVAPAARGIDLFTRATDLLNMFPAEKNVHGQNWLKRSACPLNSGTSGCC